MTVTGTVKKADSGMWVVKTAEGKEYELKGAKIEKRMEGLTVRVVGTAPDDGGMGGFFDEGPTAIEVQRLRVV